MPTLILALLLASSPAVRPHPRVLHASLANLPNRQVAAATLIPLTQREVIAVLSHPIGQYLGPIGRARGQLKFEISGRVINGECDPAACMGRFAVAGNRLILRFDNGSSNYSYQRYSFFMDRTGLVYVTTDDRRAQAIPW